MKAFILFALILLAPLDSLSAEETDGTPNDQLLVIFGSSGYILYKVLDFANDHGFRYIKILSYEFNAFAHKISGSATSEPPHGGRYFELRDENSAISFLCYEEAPEDLYVIDLNKYHPLLEKIIGQ